VVKDTLAARFDETCNALHEKMVCASNLLAKFVTQILITTWSCRCLFNGNKFTFRNCVIEGA